MNSPVERALSKAAQVQNRLAQGFAGNGASVNTDAADGPLAIDDRDFFAQLGSADGALLTGGSAANYYQVVFMVFHTVSTHCLATPVRIDFATTPRSQQEKYQPMGNYRSF